MKETLDDLTQIWLTDERLLDFLDLQRRVRLQYAEIGRLQEEIDRLTSTE